MPRYRLEVRLSGDELAELRYLANAYHRTMPGQVRAMLAAYWGAVQYVRQHISVEETPEQIAAKLAAESSTE